MKMLDKGNMKIISDIYSLKMSDKATKVGWVSWEARQQGRSCDWKKNGGHSYKVRNKKLTKEAVINKKLSKEAVINKKLTKEANKQTNINGNQGRRCIWKPINKQTKNVK